eukprot:1493968-Rhodomonas_salina.4
MIRIRRRKNDKYREGLFPHISPARNQQYDILSLLRMYLTWAKLGPSSTATAASSTALPKDCTRLQFPAEVCVGCGPLFRSMSPSGTEVSQHRVSKALPSLCFTQS